MLKIDNILYYLRDLFPSQNSSQNVCIGGSYSRKRIASTKEETTDIDFYIKGRICRYVFKDILEKIIFKGIIVSFEDDRGSEHYLNYNMPGLYRRISLSFPKGQYPPMEFLFIETDLPLSAYLIRYQASTISECALTVAYDGARWGIKPVYSYRFRDLFISKSSKEVVLNVHPEVCAQSQLRKVGAFCKDNNLNIKVIREPY